MCSSWDCLKSWKRATDLKRVKSPVPNFLFVLSSLQYWSDFRLKWNSSAYGGIKSFVTSSKKVWLPDITLYNKWVLIVCFKITYWRMTILLCGSVVSRCRIKWDASDWKESMSWFLLKHPNGWPESHPYLF